MEKLLRSLLMLAPQAVCTPLRGVVQAVQDMMLYSVQGVLGAGVAGGNNFKISGSIQQKVPKNDRAKGQEKGAGGCKEWCRHHSGTTELGKMFAKSYQLIGVIITIQDFYYQALIRFKAPEQRTITCPGSDCIATIHMITQATQVSKCLIAIGLES